MTNLEQAISRFRDYLSKIEEREILFDLALSVFRNSDSAIRWLLTPQPSLGDKLPFNCKGSEVKNVLLAIEYGVYQ